MSRGKKRAAIAGLLIVAAVLLMTVSQRNEGAFGFLKPLAYPFEALGKGFSSLSNGVSDTWTAKEDNARLREELLTATMEQQRLAALPDENRRLRELLNLKEQLPPHSVAARIIARGHDRFMNTLIVDKGNRDGVRKDMAVMTPRGLAGKVLSVQPDTAEIMLITDPNFSVAVRLQRGRVDGILTGTGQRHCVLKYIPTEEPIKVGEDLITSGLDSIFPPGLPVGRISKVRTEGVEFFQLLEVAPFAPTRKMEEVMLIAPAAPGKTPRAAGAGNTP